jgi:FAD:protein FMN transferase
MKDIAESRLHVFGRPCHLLIGDSQDNASELMSLAHAELSRLENKFCSFRTTSVIHTLNRLAGNQQTVSIDRETASLLHYANALWSSSNKLFDPTTCVFHPCYANTSVSDNTLALAAEKAHLANWSALQMSADQASLTLPGAMIDLNNCVRPYAVDCVRKLLLQHGASSAMIDLDRDISTIGRQPSGANWLPGFRHPRGNRMAIGKFKLNNSSYTLRGDFERALLRNGERYGRSFNPADGSLLPGLLSVAVIADSCLTACSAASVARLKPEEEALQWLDELGMPWLAIDRQLNCHGPLAPALGGSLKPR